MPLVSGKAGSKLSGRVGAEYTAARDFSQQACQLLMNSHSVLSPPHLPLGPLVLQFVKISWCAKSKTKCTRGTKGQSAVPMALISCITVFQGSLSLPASWPKNRGNTKVFAGQGVYTGRRERNGRCLLCHTLSFGSGHALADRHSERSDLGGALHSQSYIFGNNVNRACLCFIFYILLKP